MDKVGNGQTRTATAHFVAYGGGNALVLMDKPNRAAKVVDDNDGPKQEFIEGKKTYDLSVGLLGWVLWLFMVRFDNIYVSSVPFLN